MRIENKEKMEGNQKVGKKMSWRNGRLKGRFEY